MTLDETRAGAGRDAVPARPAPEPVPFPAPRQPARRVRTIDDELAAIANVLGHPVSRADACAALVAERPDLEVLADPETLGILRGNHLDEIAAAIRAHLLGVPGGRRPWRLTRRGRVVVGVAGSVAAIPAAVAFSRAAIVAVPGWYRQLDGETQALAQGALAGVGVVLVAFVVAEVGLYVHDRRAARRGWSP